MPTPRSAYVETDGHELHVTEWGEPGRPAIVMWHGLARHGRDFDELAAALSDTYFVLCPDTLGRAGSSWARDPATEYTYPAYGAHAAAILDHYEVQDIRWVGTSMGGLLGMSLAASTMRERITHLVVNDVGPFIPAAALKRIAAYVGNPPVFATHRELEAWLRAVYGPFGLNSEAFWRRMGDLSARRIDDGRVTVHYDPRIAHAFGEDPADMDIWPLWDAVAVRTLLLRGATSDVLTAETAREMTMRGPRPELVEFEGVGHAPTLASADQIAVVRNFLAA